jgi:uncharacterized protein (DUF736 family)
MVPAFNEKEKVMAYNIGFFKATNSGYEGTIETLALKISAEFTRVIDRTNENAPAFEIFSGDLRIGAAWERQGRKGKYLSVDFQDPSFAPGYYNLFKSGIEHSYTLTFERPRAPKKD